MSRNVDNLLNKTHILSYIALLLHMDSLIFLKRNLKDKLVEENLQNWRRKHNMLLSSLGHSYIKGVVCNFVSLVILGNYLTHDLNKKYLDSINYCLRHLKSTKQIIL